MKMSDNQKTFLAAALTMLVLTCGAWFLDPIQTASAQGVLQWVTLPDVAGTGSASQLLGSGASVRLCQMVAPSSNASAVRWGDASITTSRGAAIAPGGGQFLPPGGTSSPYAIDLTTTYVLVAVGDKLEITCAR